MKIASSNDCASPTVGDVMTSEVYGVAPGTSLETAKRMLTKRQITGAPVVDPEGRPVGVVTLSDLADPDRPRSDKLGYPLYYYMSDGQSRQVGGDARVTDGVVSDVMNPSVLSVAATTTVAEAAKMMIHERVHRLLVLNDTKLVGIVSSIDLLRGFVNSQR